MRLPPAASSIIHQKAPHWESKLVQALLFSASDEVNRSCEKATLGTNALGFADWTRTFLTPFEQLLHEATAVFEGQLATATRSAGDTGNPDMIVDAVDHLLGIINDAIVLQQRAVFLTLHPLFGIIAEPLRQLAKPFVEGFNDLLRQLDEQLQNIDLTHRLQLHLTLKAPPYLDEYPDAYEKYIEQFGDDHILISDHHDAATKRFHVARGTDALGEFGRSSIADNLTNGLLRPDDWYWSPESGDWKPLSQFV